jgi:hypothetical protein
LKKYICTRGWQRNSTGDILEEWEYNRLPDEVKNRNFKEYVAEQPAKPTPRPVENIKPKPSKPEPQKLEWFNLDEVDSKEE